MSFFLTAKYASNKSLCVSWSPTQMRLSRLSALSDCGWGSRSWSKDWWAHALHRVLLALGLVPVISTRWSNRADWLCVKKKSEEVHGTCISAPWFLLKSRIFQVVHEKKCLCKSSVECCVCEFLEEYACVSHCDWSRDSGGEACIFQDELWMNGWNLLRSAPARFVIWMPLMSCINGTSLADDYFESKQESQNFEWPIVSAPQVGQSFLHFYFCCSRQVIVLSVSQNDFTSLGIVQLSFDLHQGQASKLWKIIAINAPWFSFEDSLMWWPCGCIFSIISIVLVILSCGQDYQEFM